MKLVDARYYTQNYLINQGVSPMHSFAVLAHVTRNFEFLLNCSVFCFIGMSIGPTVEGAHSPDERIEIRSAVWYMEWLQTILAMV